MSSSDDDSAAEETSAAAEETSSAPGREDRLARAIAASRCQGHGTLHHLIEVIHSDCVASSATARFHTLLQEHLAGHMVSCTLDFEKGGHNWSLYYPLQFNFHQTPADAVIQGGAKSGAKARTMEEHYTRRFCVGSSLPERVLVEVVRSSRSGQTSRATGEHPGTMFLLPQHLCPYSEQQAPLTFAESRALGETARGPSQASRAANEERFQMRIMEFNRQIALIRRELHWPRMKLLLLGARDGVSHSGLEHLDNHLVCHIGHFLLRGPVDAEGRQTAGIYMPGFELDPRAFGAQQRPGDHRYYYPEDYTRDGKRRWDWIK